MSATPAADAAARQRAVDTTASVLVQAPAGSGKTTLLAQRYLRLLAAVDAPECILALTFTRRAAEEMRIRVVEALASASAPECPAGENPRTFMLAAAARRHLQSLGIDVVLHPSRLRIETIDSFNAWLAAQLPITSGAGGRLALAENAGPLYEEAARRTLAHQGADSFGAAVERVLAVGDQRFSQLLGLIVEMLPTRDRWLPLLVGRLQAASALDEAQLANVRTHFDEDLDLLMTRVIKEAHELLGQAALTDLLRCLCAAAPRVGGERPEVAAWADEHGALEPRVEDLARWRRLATFLLTRDPKGKLRASVNKNDGFPPGCAEKATMSDLLAEFARRPSVARALKAVRGLPERGYGDDDWERVRDVARVLVLAAAELDAVFRAQGRVDFPAVSMAALRALGRPDAPTDLGLKLDYRLQHLLLDEFQDTSTAQLELVRILTAGWERGDGRSVFCVGDPMQSIYGFRQAEVRAFLELADEGIGDLSFEVERLSSNFRSASELVEWINRCFERVLPRSDDRARGAIAFRRSQSALPALPNVEPEVSCLGYATRAEEAYAVAELIEAIRARHPTWRIAVLVRARVHAREIAHGLRARGIAFRALDLEPLQDRPLVRDLVMLVCALLHLADRPAWLALLRAPWAGLDLSDLLSVARARPIVWDALRDDGVLDALSEEGRARCMRLRGVLDAAFQVQTHTTTARWVERTWIALGGPGCAADERELEHVRTAFARLRELEAQDLPDAADLARAFADLYAAGDPADAVEIMTIHKSKGLEFECVIVPALDRHGRVPRGQLLLTHTFSRTGRAGMVMAARPAVGARNSLFDFLRSLEREAESLEAERLLYVACTRAKYRLHLTATVGPHIDPDALPGEDADENASRAAKVDAPRRPHAGSLLSVLCRVEEIDAAFTLPQPSARDLARVRDAEVVEQEAELAGLRGGPLLRAPRGWSPPAIEPRAFTPGKSAAIEREETPIFDWAGETARRIGSLVHAELQTLDPRGSGEELIRARRSHYERWLARHGVPAELVSQAAERVVAALAAVHRDPRAQWILAQGYRDDFREHALSGLWRGEVVRAVFDRSFVDENGIRWVIDYKTSRHSGGGLEEFLDSEVERYRPQLERYAALAQRLGPERVRVGLYFPLMSAWREWDP